MLDNKSMILKCVCGVAFCAIFLAGCGNYNSHMDKMLHEQVCERNASFKVGLHRDVILFVKHHIMVGNKRVYDNREESVGFLRTPKERISWENSRFSIYRKETIPPLMREVNEILYKNNTNIYLVNDSFEVHIDEAFFPADFDLLFKPQGHTKKTMEAMVAADPEYIHIFYGWTSATSVIVAGEKFAVVVADDPRYGRRVSSLDLAREIINALGYQPDVNSLAEYHLLHHAATDDSISDEQRFALWEVVNEQGQALKSISCNQDQEVWVPGFDE